MKNKTPEQALSVHANPAITFNKVCPAIIFANKRIDKLTGLKTYEITSIGTRSNANAKDVPDGKNNEKKAKPWVRTQTMLKAMKIKRAREKVTIKWLVNVKLYGINPIRFKQRITKNAEKITGKNFWPPFNPKLSTISPKMTL